MQGKTFTLNGLQDLRKAGLYYLYKDDVVVYIGVSKNIYVRVLEHCFEEAKEFDSIKVDTFDGAFNQTLLEVFEVMLISKQKPKYNKLVVNDLFSYYNSLPSVVIKELGNNQDYKEMDESANIILNSLSKKEFIK